MAGLLRTLDDRSTFERAALRLSRRRLEREPRGDGRPVIVLPGHHCTDWHSTELRAVLGSLGHDAQGWGLGENDAAHDLLDRVQRLVQGFDEPVALVGVSLGGVYAREVARRDPERVRFVATLGAPLQGAFGFQPDRDLGAIPVPTLCVVARFDQYVRRANATITGDPHAEILTVLGGHCGLVSNPVVMRHLARRLASS